MRALLLLVALVPLRAHAEDALPIIVRHHRDASGHVRPSRAEEAELRAGLERALRDGGPRAFSGGYFAVVEWNHDPEVWFHAYVSDGKPPHALGDRAWWDRHGPRPRDDATTTFDVTCWRAPHGCGIGTTHRVAQ